jgi:hypothetical protein
MNRRALLFSGLVVVATRRSTGAGPVAQNTGMATLKEDIVAAADWICHALHESNYQADFSPRSLWEIERFFDEHSAGGKPRAGGLLAQDTGKRLFAVGGYIGETLRRARGGEWQASDADPQGEINIALVLTDGTQCWPVQRAMKRLSAGDSDSVAAYGLSLGLDVGPRPKPPGFLERLRRRY